ncbi:CcmD family protein [Sphingobacterium sp. HJSM2_6]|uniref:CcmD family protein n=1 Tax=Sphingobacterium sp. HJSM2_6 TaxID=3366264 RepID=UPI003BCBC575
MKNFLLSIFIGMLSISTLFAQEQVPMADGLRSEGKIYVVILVLLVIFFAIALFLFSLDRRIKKLEKHN